MALEEKAELIRRGLEAVPPEMPPRLPPRIPPALLAQIEAYDRDRRAYETERRAYTLTLPLPVSDRNGDTVRKTVAALEHRRVEGSAEFDRKNAERLAGLRTRAYEVRRALEVLAASRVDPATGKSMTADTLMQSQNAANAAFAAQGRKETIYREYRIALLQPGLSPEQRRLLFVAVVSGLAQPLPSGELMPRKSVSTPPPAR